MVISRSSFFIALAAALLVLGLVLYLSVSADSLSSGDTQHGEAWRYSFDPQKLAAQIQQPKPTDRGRVQIVDNTLVTDNGLRLRGEHLRIAELPWEDGTHLDRAYNRNVWLEMADTFHLNTVRLLLYRPPQNWPGGPGDDCPVERCFATVQDAIPHIDAMVEIASSNGMYVIIDYHPVGGYDKNDAISWWSALAPRYKDRTHVIYELSNEPVMWSASSYGPEDIQFEQDLYQLIRSHAPNAHILLWTFAEAGGPMLDRVQSAHGISYDNASVAYHPYKYDQSAINELRNAGYPVIDTEIGGSNRDDYLTRTTNEENLGVSWIWLDGTGFNKSWGETNPLPVTWPKDPSSGTISRVTDGLQVLYTFAEGSGTTIHDVSNVGEPLNLTVGDLAAVRWESYGLSIESPTIIESAVAATKVISACKNSNEVTIEAWIRPANTTQDGPARFVTLSADLDNLNFMLGQGSASYDARLRTDETGDGGSSPLTAPDGAATLALSHIVYTRDTSGVRKIYVDTTEVVSGTIGGGFGNWDDSYALALANEFTGDRPWLGEFYLVAVYNRALSQAEVRQNFRLAPRPWTVWLPLILKQP